MAGRWSAGDGLFDVLVALIEANGAVVSKDALMTRVWPGRIVEDNNLHAQIKAFRKAFAGHDVIRTIVGRGYQCLEASAAATLAAVTTPEISSSPVAAATVDRDHPGTRQRPSSAIQTPSANRGKRRRATSTASRVLPMPPCSWQSPLPH
jgi:DNA-binding winged helix-turn-helix (wHTH) protein